MNEYEKQRPWVVILAMGIFLGLALIFILGVMLLVEWLT